MIISELQIQISRHILLFLTQPPGEKPNPRLSVIKGDDVELRCRAEADQLLDMAYKWRLNGLTIRYPLNLLI